MHTKRRYIETKIQQKKSKEVAEQTRVGEDKKKDSFLSNSLFKVFLHLGEAAKLLYRPTQTFKIFLRSISSNINKGKNQI